mmetsp:Transcript_29195/g.64757  ORF Transcript_29195/g.64757 Transcript_29195/m.64757 type:complete len:96 (+) Transcript_29195:1191-1478(+)
MGALVGLREVGFRVGFGTFVGWEVEGERVGDGVFALLVGRGLVGAGTALVVALSVGAGAGCVGLGAVGGGATTLTAVGDEVGATGAAWLGTVCAN